MDIFFSVYLYSDSKNNSNNECYNDNDDITDNDNYDNNYKKLRRHNCCQYSEIAPISIDIYTIDFVIIVFVSIAFMLLLFLIHPWNFVF